MKTNEKDDKALAARLLADLRLNAGERDHLLFYELPRVRAVSDLIHASGADAAAAAPLRVLDIGFLSGVVPYTLFALDPSGRLRITSTERAASDGLQLAERLRAQGVFPQKRFHVTALDLDQAREDGNLSGWDERAGTLDRIVLGEVIEHVPSVHVPKMLRFFHRLLAPDGRVIITTPNLHGMKMRLRHLLGIDFLHDPLDHPVMGYGHVNLFSSRQLCDLARAEKFRVGTVAYHEFTSGKRRHGADGASRAARLSERLRVATLSRLFPSTREDLVLCFERAETVQPTSAVYGQFNGGFRAGLRAVRVATRPDKGRHA